MIAWMVAERAAEAADREICAEVHPHFQDALYVGTGRYDLDDYFNDNSVHQPLLGADITVSRSGYSQQHYASDVDGCATFTGLNTSLSYTITVTSDVVVSGHLVIEMSDDTTFALYPDVTLNWTPPLLPVVTTDTIDGVNSEWDQLLTVGFALSRRDGNQAPQIYYVYHQPCPLCSGNNPGFGIDPYSFPATYLSDTNYKGIIAHEFGHLLLYQYLGHGANNNAAAEFGQCFGKLTASHELQRKEYSAEAFWEGFAAYYSALVFNNTAQGECFHQYYKAENYDRDLGGVTEPFTTNCGALPPWDDWNGNPMDGVSRTNQIDGYDYFDNVINKIGCDVGGGGFTSDGVQVNRATELDYVRFFWAIQQAGLTFGHGHRPAHGRG